MSLFISQRVQPLIQIQNPQLLKDWIGEEMSLQIRLKKNVYLCKSREKIHGSKAVYER